MTLEALYNNYFLDTTEQPSKSQYHTFSTAFTDLGLGLDLMGNGIFVFQFLLSVHVKLSYHTGFKYISCCPTWYCNVLELTCHL